MAVPEEHQDKSKAGVVLAESYNDPIECKPLASNSQSSSNTICNNKRKSVEITRRLKKVTNESGTAMTAYGDENIDSQRSSKRKKKSTKDM